MNAQSSRFESLHPVVPGSIDDHANTDFDQKSSEIKASSQLNDLLVRLSNTTCLSAPDIHNVAQIMVYVAKPLSHKGGSTSVFILDAVANIDESDTSAILAKIIRLIPPQNLPPLADPTVIATLEQGLSHAPSFSSPASRTAFDRKIGLNDGTWRDKLDEINRKVNFINTLRTRVLHILNGDSAAYLVKISSIADYARRKKFANSDALFEELEGIAENDGLKLKNFIDKLLKTISSVHLVGATRAHTTRNIRASTYFDRVFHALEVGTGNPEGLPVVELYKERLENERAR